MKNVKHMMRNILLILFAFFFYDTMYAQSRKVSNERLLAYYQTGKYLEAVDYLKNIYGEDTENVKGLTKLGYSYLMANKLQEAENAYLRVLSLDAGNLAALSGLATANTLRHRNEVAAGYYRQILSLDTTDHVVYLRLAQLNPNDTTQRSNYLKKAFELNPRDPQTAVEFAELLIKRNDFGTAEDVLEKALAADSANIQLLKTMLPVNIGMKKYRNAIKLGEYILAEKDSSMVVLDNLGKAYYAMFEFSKALKCYLNITSTALNNKEELYYNVASCYRELRDYANEEKYLDKAIKEGVSQKTASYYGLLGDSFDNRNMTKEAMEAYKKGLQFENRGSLLYSIAQVYENRLNDKKNAIDYYNQYLKTLDPKDKPKLIKFINAKIAELTERSKR